MRTFHPATVVDKQMGTADSVRLTLALPEDATDEFRYAQGQHVPVRATIDGDDVRRTYSICASVADAELRLGIRVQKNGVFSNYIAEQLKIGDSLEVMAPAGHFYTELDSGHARIYAAFVAGSGITPVYSIVKTTLETEPASRFLVFYGNRRRASTMLIEDLWALKNLYPDRLSLHFIMSREPAELELYNGRLDGAKVQALHTAFLTNQRPEEVFVCGPDSMIDDVSAALAGLGYDRDRIHTERFRPASARADHPETSEEHGDGTLVTVIMDGQRQTFQMSGDDESILDAAENSGLDLPFSCRDGVCSTCRTKLTSGEVEMEVNYALEQWELDEGYILACQARPKTAELELDYDQA